MKKKKEFEFIYEYSLKKDGVSMEQIEDNAKRILNEHVIIHNNKKYNILGYWIKTEYDLDTIKVIFEVDDSL